MYPYFIIQGHKIFAMGIGIIISTIVFIAVAWYFSKQYKLKFSKFFFWLPTLFIASYILGNWVGLALDSGIRFPFRSWKTIGSLLSPYGYHFHFIGLVLGARYARRKFYKTIYLKSEKAAWVDTMFLAFAASLIPMGLFLLLGDNFIGKPTEARYGVIPLLNDSQRINTSSGHVFPLGIMVSIMGFLSYVVILLCKKLFNKDKVRGYLGFALVFFAFALLFLAQIYVRHGVFKLGNYTRDIKNYFALFMAIVSLIMFVRTTNKR